MIRQSIIWRDAKFDPPSVSGRYFASDGNGDIYKATYDLGENKWWDCREENINYWVELELPEFLMNYHMCKAQRDRKQWWIEYDAKINAAKEGLILKNLL